jgi:PAS domain S-box-containing protein
MAVSDDQVRRQADQDAAVAAAFGDPARIALLRALTETHGPLSVSALAAASGLRGAKLAGNLAALTAAGVLVQTEYAGESFGIAETPLGRTVRAMLQPTPNDSSAASPATDSSQLSHMVPASFAAILDQMASGIAIYDREGVLVQLNPAGERITGCPAIPGESQADRIARYALRCPDGNVMPVEMSPSGRALHGETISDMECIINGQHGRDTWLRCSASPLRDDHGAILGAVVSFVDISDQHHLSHEEAHQRTLAQAMIENTFSGMAIFDANDNFRCIQHNENFLRLLGKDALSRGSIVGATLSDLFEGEILTQTLEIHERVRTTGQPFVVDEFAATIPPDPRQRWFRWRLSPLRDEQGHVTELLSVAFEVTELVESRNDARRRATELDAVIKAIPEGVMLVDKSGKIIVFNAAAEQIIGQQMPNVYPENPDAVASYTYALDGRRLDTSELPIVRALQGETVLGEELVFQRPDSERVDLLTSAAPVDFESTGDITGAVAAFQDITQIKQLERQRDDFIGIAAHELRTPLATIMATLQAFLRRQKNAHGELGIDVEKLSTGLERMYRQSQRLNTLVSDLLDTTRIRTGTLDYALVPCDLAVVVREAVAGQTEANPTRKVVLSAPQHQVMVRGDAFRLSQVVDNLVANAIKYSADQMPVKVSLSADKSTARLRVVDKGVGIPPENIEHLFDRFYRVPGIDVQSGPRVGLGLGLHITHTLVQRHGGHINVRSTPGSGTTFEVVLPLLKNTERAEDVHHS